MSPRMRLTTVTNFVRPFFMSEYTGSCFEAVRVIVKDCAADVVQSRASGMTAAGRTASDPQAIAILIRPPYSALIPCLLYTSDAADEEDSVDLGGRRIIKKKKNEKYE
eukprot:TRINITY_DN801_c0_g1_i5.p2 TRINITY_DN801_c0_g1~~TRINITY_DN801_c0_g1_i5.p2  ORF type:complete len:108 (-),score=24.07 TRINITY_DN801_c0_g1_i5:75-398(-)